MQTTEYVKAITRAARPDIDADDLDGIAKLRRERQEQLDGGQPPHLHLYLNEAVVRRTVGSPGVMREQLDYLVTASKLDHVSLRVVPLRPVTMKRAARNKHPMPETQFSHWRKSTRSSPNGQCVEVGFAPGMTGIRDTKDRGYGTLSVSADAWTAFLTNVKADKLDQ